MTAERGGGVTAETVKAERMRAADQLRVDALTLSERAELLSSYAARDPVGGELAVGAAAWRVRAGARRLLWLYRLELALRLQAGEP